MSDRAARSRSFESAATEYEQHRPEYPAEAIDWAAAQLRLPAGARVVDVGAGTGKLTRGLVAAGFDVAAVEPGGAMLEQLRRAVPEADAHQAPAESIPLPDASVDAVFAAQAFHWFDREVALAEFHRAIRPGGGLVLIWNWWDERDPLQRDLGEAIGYAGLTPYREPELPGPPWFEEIGRKMTESVDDSSPEQLVGMLSTTSTYLTAEPGEGEQWLNSIREKAAAYGSSFPLPKLTYVFVYRRRDA